MTADELHAMSDEALHELSLKKGRKGNASWEAKQAQKEIVRRNGGNYIGAGRGTPNCYALSDVYMGKWQKKFK